jgi:hypothetical protein
VHTEPDVVLESAQLRVQVRPAKGFDIVSIADRASGTEVLFRSPWRGAIPVEAGWDDRSRWLAQYPGGWQLLCPNAGPSRAVDGAIQGFHGEAAVVPWHVERPDERSVTGDVELFSAPLALRRTVELEGATVRVRTSVLNLSDAPRSVALVEHVGFGAPLLDAGSRLDFAGGDLVADDAAPGTLLAASLRAPWPVIRSRAGDLLDLRDLPGKDEPREVFAALTELRDGWSAISNARLGLGAALWWETAALPHAWLWQEVHASAAFPWFGRAYVLGVEPANVLPGHGMTRPPAPELEGGATLETTIELTVFTAAGCVTDVGRGGRVEQRPQ